MVQAANTELYYIDTNLLLESTPLIKFIRNHIQDSRGIFSISSVAKISVTSLISCLTLKLYLHLLEYDQYILQIYLFSCSTLSS